MTYIYIEHHEQPRFRVIKYRCLFSTQLVPHLVDVNITIAAARFNKIPRLDSQ